MLGRRIIYLSGIIYLLFFIPAVSCSISKNKNLSESIDWFQADSLCKVHTNDTLEEVILNYEGFTVSFNPELHIPNWVAWVLTKERVENSQRSRRDNFRSDTNVPGCATLKDYKGSGYERGHMAPAGDMKWSETALEDASYLTNICPQVHELNNGTWRSLEEKCRSNVMRGDSILIIVCGPVNTIQPRDIIGESNVRVPSLFFKVILSPFSAKGPQAIGFIMPNGKVEGGMQKAVFSVNEVEEITGHDFFSFLPDSVEERLERMKDFNRFSYR